MIQKGAKMSIKKLCGSEYLFIYNKEKRLVVINSFVGGRYWGCSAQKNRWYPKTIAIFFRLA